MWRYLRKRRALASYRTTLFKYLRQTYGRKLHYSTDEVRDGVAAMSLSNEFACYALGMFCDRAAFDAFHAASGELCDYGTMRSEVFAHVADVPFIHGAQFDAGCTHHGHDAGAHHDFGAHHDVGGFESGFDSGSHH
jgi:hypothetical protein